MKKIFLSLIILILGISIIGIVEASPALEPASVLVFPFFLSDPDYTTTDSMVSVTNTNNENDTCARYTFFEYDSCNEFNFDLCFTPNQVISLNISDYVPSGGAGFLVVSAIYPNGTLKDFDYLIGNMYVKYPDYLPGGEAYAPIPIKKIADDPVLDASGIIMFGNTYTDIPKYLIEDYYLPNSQVFAQYLVLTPSEDPAAAGLPSFNLFSFQNGNVRIELENYIWDNYEYYISDYNHDGDCGIHGNLSDILNTQRLSYYGWAELLRNPDATLGLTAGYNIGGVKLSSSESYVGASELHRSEEGVTGKLIISNKPVSGLEIY